MRITCQRRQPASAIFPRPPAWHHVEEEEFIQLERRTKTWKDEALEKPFKDAIMRVIRARDYIFGTIAHVIIIMTGS